VDVAAAFGLPEAFNRANDLGIILFRLRRPD
jgi:hypothetical protein